MSRMVTHETNLVIRVLGTHDPLVEVVSGQVQVTMPGAVITIADAKAANAVFRAWIETENVARQAFTGPAVATRLYPRPAQRVMAAVRLAGDQSSALTITGKAPLVSPSGVGQVVVKLGCLTVVCDDRAAWESQHRTWCAAHRAAGTVWKVAEPAMSATRSRDRSQRWTVAKHRRK